MTAHAPAPREAARVRPITVAIFAMGGEGGGVLSDWLVDMAEHGGYLAQTTSVPGVAQRTGATIYYLELFPRAAVEARGREPVLALMPVPGDVDVVIASELMEAGRAVQRGFVTPDRTILLASTHRVYAMTERIALGDGRVDSAGLLEGCREAARELVAFDMAGLAEATGSVISAVLFGALAGSGALPFGRPDFEAAIRRGGVGVQASLAAFGAGLEASTSDKIPPAPAPSARAAESEPGLETAKGDAATKGRPETKPAGALAGLLREAEESFDEPALGILREGLARAVDYQDHGYARLFLDRMRPFAGIERDRGDGTGRLAAETARALALGMTYEDTPRVADLKIRPDRFARVRDEVRVGEAQILEIVEFMHPRVQEIAETLPAPAGRWLLRTGWARGLLGRLTRKGRIIRTSSIGGFLLLYAVAAMKPLRPRSLRYASEQESLERWLRIVADTAGRDYALAVEVAECRTLVKGYGDTLERGRERFDSLMAVLPDLVGRANAAPQLASLLRAALADDTGQALSNAIAAMRPDVEGNARLPDARPDEAADRSAAPKVARATEPASDGAALA